MNLATGIIRRRSNFADEQAITAARLFNEAGRQRGTFVDCMIAAIALSEGAMIATSNVSDFRQFETFGLKIAPF